MKKKSLKPNAVDTKEWHKLNEVAKILGVHVKTVGRMIKPTKKNGKVRQPVLRAYNISTGKGRPNWRIDPRDLQEFFNRSANNCE